MSQLDLRPKTVRSLVTTAVPEKAYYLYGAHDESDPASPVTLDVIPEPEVARVRLSNSTATVETTRMRYWSLLDTVADMSNLPEDHDYAVPVDTALFALDVLTKLSERSIEPPRIFSTDSDGLTFSWDRGALRHYLQVDKSDLDHLVVRPGYPKLYCHNEVVSTWEGRAAWLEDFAGPPLSSTAEEDAL